MVKPKNRKISLCRSCGAEESKRTKAIYKSKNSKLTIDEIRALTPELTCSSCKTTKSSDEFTRSNSARLGLNSNCMDCGRIKSNNVKAKFTENFLKKTPDEIRSETKQKICTNCGEEKRSSEFNILRSGKDGLHHHCRECAREKLNNWRCDSDIHRKTRRKYESNAYRKSHHRRLRILIGRRIRQSLINKTNNSEKYLGCTIQEAVHHIESLFVDGMSWYNSNLWHIDHIKPISSFDLTKKDEILKCFNIKNLQPLWAEENLRKSNKWDEESNN